MPDGSRSCLLQDDDATAAGILASTEPIEHQSTVEREVRPQLRAGFREELADPSRIWQQEDDPVHISISLFQFETAPKGLAVPRAGFGLDGLAQPVPRIIASHAR